MPHETNETMGHAALQNTGNDTAECDVKRPTTDGNRWNDAVFTPPPTLGRALHLHSLLPQETQKKLHRPTGESVTYAPVRFSASSPHPVSPTPPLLGHQDSPADAGLRHAFDQMRASARLICAVTVVRALPMDCANSACFASMSFQQAHQYFSAVWADGFPRSRHHAVSDVR